MKEENFTLYIEGIDENLLNEIYKSLVELLEKLEIKHKKFDYYKIVEIQIGKYDLFYAMFLDMTKEYLGINKKYTMSDIELKNILNYRGKTDKEKFKNIFEDFITSKF